MRYSKDFICFDIETSTIETDIGKQSFIYHWQTATGNSENNFILHNSGRTWESAVEFFEQLRYRKDVLLIYVHNLSYEFVMLYDYFVPEIETGIFESDTKTKMFRLKKKHGYKGFLEFRCTAKMSNMSLRKIGDLMGFPKLELNYDVIRFPWSELTQDELEYNFRDVDIMIHYLKDQIKKLNEINTRQLLTTKGMYDGLITHPKDLPITATGKVRRLMRRNFTERNKKYIEYLDKPTDLLYLVFRGAYVYSNYNAYGKLYNVHHVDLTSAYIYTLLCKKYPIGNFRKSENYTAECSYGMVRLSLELKPHHHPYIASDKVLASSDKVEQNGKIISATDLLYPATNVDIDLIALSYKITKFEVVEWYENEKVDYLPESVRKAILYWWTEKCTLSKNHPIYGETKAGLNSNYGMAATREIVEKFEAVERLIVKTGTDELKTVMPYQWALWVTAYARQLVYELLEFAGDAGLQCDTDSVFFNADSSRTLDIMNYINTQNEYFRKKSEKMEESGKYQYIINGKILGTWDYEHKNVPFYPFGSKRYAVCNNGIWDVTLAGVPGAHSENGHHGKTISYLLAKYDSMENIMQMLRKGENITIPYAITNKMRPVFNYHEEPHQITIDGHRLNIYTNTVLEPVEYQLHRVF